MNTAYIFFYLYDYSLTAKLKVVKEGRSAIPGLIRIDPVTGTGHISEVIAVVNYESDPTAALAAARVIAKDNNILAWDVAAVLNR